MRILSAIFLGLVLAAPAQADKVVLFGQQDPRIIGKLESPFGVAFVSDTVYIVEMTANRVQRAGPFLEGQGQLVAFAGTGAKGDAGDGGPAVKAQLNGPHHVVRSIEGDVYVADTFNNRI